MIISLETQVDIFQLFFLYQLRYFCKGKLNFKFTQSDSLYKGWIFALAPIIVHALENLKDKVNALENFFIFYFIF